MRATVAGIGLVGGFGAGPDDLARAMAHGPPPPSTVVLRTTAGEIEVPGRLADTAPLAGFADQRALRRLDHHTRMALLSCLLGLSDAGCGLRPPEETGIVLATGYGATCNTFDVQGLCVDADIRTFSPTQFSNSVHNAPAAHISDFLKIRGPNLTVNHFDLSVPAAVATARLWLAEGRTDRVLVVAVDTFSKLAAFHRHRTLIRQKMPEGPAAPAPIGEGAVCFLLTGGGAGSRALGEISAAVSGNAAAPAPGTESTVYILGADGLSRGESKYRDWVPPGAPAVVYTDLYGNLPIGTAFDAATALITAREGKLFPSAGGARCPHGPVQAEEPLARRAIRCVKLGSAGGHGVVTVAPPRSSGAN